MLESAKRFYANIPQRWILAFMCFLAIFNAYTMRVCLSIAMTEMVLPTIAEENITDNTCPSLDRKEHVNSTVEIKTGTYEWSEYTQGLILSSFYWGYVATNLPSGIIVEKYGGKHTLGIGMLLVAVFTVLTPIAIFVGDSAALITLRVLMGLGEGIVLPAVSVLLAQWTPPNERSRTGSFVLSGSLVGLIFATALSGWILRYSEMNWPLVFYVMGTIGVIWFLIWLVTCYKSPRDHPFITKKEVDYLNERMNEHTHEKPPPAPWRHILKSKPLWASVLALIGFNWTFLTLITDLPKYMSSVLKLGIENNGYFCSLVYVGTWISGNLSSWLVDHLVTRNKLSITRVRKIGSVISLAVSATFIVAASYAGCDYVLFVGLLLIALTALGTGYSTILITPLDLSPNYVGTLMGVANGLSVCAGIISPYLIGILTPNQTLNEWRFVFWILFLVSMVSNIVFLVYGSGEVQYWNDPAFVTMELDRRKKRSEVASVEVQDNT